MAKKQTETYADIIISGAGAAGLTLAVLLGKAGLKVCVIDPADAKTLSNDTKTGRTVALMNASLNILREAEVWPRLESISNPLSVMQLIDVSLRKSDPVIEPFEASDIGEKHYGFNVPNGPLRAALYEAALLDANVTLFLEQSLNDYTVQGHQVHVTTTNGALIKAQLLCGADGRNSAVREIAGIGVDKRSYEQSAITCVVNHSKSHNDTSSEFHREHGPLAVVPLPGNQSSVVWVNKTNRADEIMAMADNDFEQTLVDETQNILGAMSLEVKPQCWPLSSIKAKSLVAERVALVAEAAHVMSPITAQGLNLSLRDVAALAEIVIDGARVGQDIGNPVTLQNYEKRRHFDIETRVFGVDTMNRVVSQDIDGIKNLRHIGLKTLGYLPPLKRFAMRVGLAPAIDAGRLSRGEAL
ncbi:MAG: FAD-dependent monooxygenase [Bdellovibrionales bacterium]